MIMLIAIPLSLTPLAQAGDPGPLCDAVASASVVAEVTLTAQGEYPSAWRRKRWEPPEEAVLPTVATARVSRVLKGDATGWVPELHDLDFSNQPATWWDAFFAAGEFRTLVLLSGTAPELDASGWQADDGGCHVSWCWDERRATVLACLETQGVTVPPETPPAAAAPAAAPPSAAAPAAAPPAAAPPAAAPPAAAPAPDAAPQGAGGWFKGCAGG